MSLSISTKSRRYFMRGTVGLTLLSLKCSKGMSGSQSRKLCGRGVGGRRCCAPQRDFGERDFALLIFPF
jgi:hypothetical protein